MAKGEGVPEENSRAKAQRREAAAGVHRPRTTQHGWSGRGVRMNWGGRWRRRRGQTDFHESKSLVFPWDMMSSLWAPHSPRSLWWL